MACWHPLQGHSKPRARFLGWFAATIVLQGIMGLIDSQIETQEISGIVDYEFVVANHEATQRAVGAWSEQQRIWVGFSLGLDFLYMPIYSTMLASAAVAVAESGFLSSVGFPLAWIPWVAVVFDVGENVGLLTILLHNASERVLDAWAMPTLIFVYTKFVGIAIGALYGIAGAVATRCCNNKPQKTGMEEGMCPDGSSAPE